MVNNGASVRRPKPFFKFYSAVGMILDSRVLHDFLKNCKLFTITAMSLQASLVNFHKNLEQTLRFRSPRNLMRDVFACPIPQWTCWHCNWINLTCNRIAGVALFIKSTLLKTVSTVLEWKHEPLSSPRLIYTLICRSRKKLQMKWCELHATLRTDVLQNCPTEPN